MNLKVILTGLTGMVGKGGVLKCLGHLEVKAVLVTSRDPAGKPDPELKEVILHDFFHPEPVMHHLSGFNACFFCLGDSAFGMFGEQYTRLTYGLAHGFARHLSRLNPEMIF